MELEYFCRPEQGMELLEILVRRATQVLREHRDLPRHDCTFSTCRTPSAPFIPKAPSTSNTSSPLGRQELEGVAYRTDYDLQQHHKASGKPLDYFDEETKERFIPHVVEPSAGVDRTVLALICDAYDEENGDG